MRSPIALRVWYTRRMKFNHIGRNSVVFFLYIRCYCVTDVTYFVFFVVSCVSTIGIDVDMSRSIVGVIIRVVNALNSWQLLRGVSRPPMLFDDLVQY